MVQHQQASTGEFVDDGNAATAPVPPKEVNGRFIMHVKVHSPFRTYFDDDAFSISAVNDAGPFDILPHHHNFMTLLNPGNIIVRGISGTKTIRINRGVLHVKSDQVVVFLDV